jgi:hypothetical protein
VQKLQQRLRGGACSLATNRASFDHQTRLQSRIAKPPGDVHFIHGPAAFPVRECRELKRANELKDIRERLTNLAAGDSLL